MNIIKNSQTNEVLWYGPQEVFINNGVYRTLEANLGIAQNNAEYLVNVPAIDFFFVGAYSYTDAGWEIMDQQVYTSGIAIIKDKKAQEVREQRNQLLQESDWTQGKDILDSLSSIWAVYRQKLRDISKQVEFPWNVVWPTKPGDKPQPTASGVQDL